jgi:predicted membrane protein
MELELARGVPMDLRLDFGAVRADLDLGGLALTDLELRTGASQTTLDVSSPNTVRLRRADLEVGAAEFTARQLGNLNTSDLSVSAGVGKVRLELTGQWRENATVAVQMGLGSLELVVPEGLGVRLVRQTFLTSLDSEGLVKRGEAYYSTNWDSAGRRVTVDVDAAFGSIKVLWIK